MKKKAAFTDIHQFILVHFPTRDVIAHTTADSNARTANDCTDWNHAEIKR